MTVGHAVKTSVPLISFAGASALAAAIVVLVPEVGREVLLALIGAWTILAAVRVVILVGYAHKLYQHLQTAHASHAA